MLVAQSELAIPFDIIGFDLDGTLVDSGADLAAAANHALMTLGVPALPAEEVVRFIGKGKRLLIERSLQAAGILSPETLAEALPLFDAYYDRHLCVHTRPYPGALAAIAMLRDMGKRLAICTNKSERFTLPLLKTLDLDGLFDAIVCGDTLGPGKLKPAPDLLHHMVALAGGGRCVFLGDTSNDIDAARAAELASIAVRFGFVDVADDLGADAILDGFDGLLPLLTDWSPDLSPGKA